MRRNSDKNLWLNPEDSKRIGFINNKEEKNEEFPKR
jgi:ATP-dependent protease ClpP protease subunit